MIESSSGRTGGVISHHAPFSATGGRSRLVDQTLADDDLRVSVIIPCYNEVHAIRETVEQLTGYFSDFEEFEIIVVNDGSSDGSDKILIDLDEEFPDLRVVEHTRNRGYGAALKTGISRARGRWIVITDADGTYPNDRLIELIELAESESADMVVGARTGADVTYPLIRKIPKVFLKRWASFLAGVDIPDMNSGMRVFRRDLAERFIKILPDTFSFTTTITLAMLTNNMYVIYIPISYKTRQGKSKIKPIRDTLRFVQLITRTGMYFAPLRVLMPVIAFIFACFIASVVYDIIWLGNLTDKTVMLFMFAMMTTIFALLADMVDKRGV